MSQSHFIIHHHQTSAVCKSSVLQQYQGTITCFKKSVGVIENNEPTADDTTTTNLKVEFKELL